MWESYKKMWWRLVLLTLYVAVVFIISRIMEAVAYLGYYERGAGYLASQLIDPVSLGVQKLKLLLDQRGVSYAGVVEKPELTALVESSGEVTETDLTLAASTTSSSSTTPAPHHFMCGAHFYEEVEDSKDSVWAVHVVRGDSSFISGRRWAELVARLAPFGVRMGVVDCSLDVRLCERKGWLSSRLVLATPRGDRAKSSVVFHTYDGTPRVQSAFDWVNSQLASRVEDIKAEDVMSGAWLHTHSEERPSSSSSLPVRVVLFTESAIPAMFFSVLSVKFAGRIKFGCVKVRTKSSRRALRHMNITRLPRYMIATPELNYTYGPPQRAETFSHHAMSLLLRCIQPEANDVFVISLVIVNAACLLHLVAGSGIIRYLVVAACNAVRWNVLLLLLWLPLLGACRLDVGQKVVALMLKVVRLVALTPLAACLRSDWLMADVTTAAIAAFIFIMFIVVLRLTVVPDETAPYWSLDTLTAYLFRPSSTPVPWSSDPEAGAVGMLIERMAVPNFWLRPSATPAYLDVLPIWSHPGEQCCMATMHTAVTPNVFTCERCRSVTETEEERADATSACAKFVMDSDYKCACRGEGGAEHTGGCMTDHHSCANRPDPQHHQREGRDPPPGMLNDPDCPVCLDTYQLGVTMCGLPCGHAFHEQCIMGWLTRDNHCCPVCRWPAYRAKPCRIHQHSE